MGCYTQYWNWTVYCKNFALGWMINRPFEIYATSNNKYVSFNRVHAKLINNLEEQICNQLNHEFNERVNNNKCEPSKEDRIFLECVSDSLHFEDGHYVISLPFKSENVCVHNNRNQVEQRLSSLQKPFSPMKTSTKNTVYYFYSSYQRITMCQIWYRDRSSVNWNIVIEIICVLC